MTGLSSVDLTELALHLAGVALLWRLALSPAARARPTEARLARWEIAPLDFAVQLWGTLAAGFGLQLIVSTAAQSAGLGGDTYLVVAAPAMPLGLLIACAGWRHLARATGGAVRFGGAFFRAGLATFLVTLPVVVVVALAWGLVLTAAGLPVAPQDLVNGFLRMESPALRAGLAFSAVVLAPFAEEWVFRGLLFRHARGRLPRWGALVLPAALWASLHGLTAFAPLLALGIVLSLAYERTGNLAVPVLAHALFNLNTLFVLLLDPPK